jgi:glutamyl/glutaminyl-tRNA synthetase
LNTSKIQYQKTRIAPTPSGFLHAGNILSFAITAALAKQSGAKILLRIDDIDQARANPQCIQDIFDTLKFLEIPWYEGPRDLKEFEDSYSQIHRMTLYRGALAYLRDNNLVYACNCSRKQLNENECSCFERHIPLNDEDVSWRLITGTDDEIIVKDYKGELIRAVLPTEMHNFVVRKKDGFPAYQLTSVVDDLFYDIDLAVRGEDLWESTLAQHRLASALKKEGFGQIAFYHHALISDASGNKLSKSAGATSIKYLRENGKSAKDIYRLIGELLGIKKDIRNWEELGMGIINN